MNELKVSAAGWAKASCIIATKATMTQGFAAETNALSSRGGLLPVPQRVLAVLDHKIDRTRSRHATRLRVKRRLAVNHAGNVLDVCKPIADRRPVDAILIHDGGEENDRIVGDRVEVVWLFVVFGSEFCDEPLDLGPVLAGEEIRFGEDAIGSVPRELDELRRVDRSRGDDRRREAYRADLARDKSAVGVIGDEDDRVGLGVAHAHQGRAEVLLIALIAFGRDHIETISFGGL